ncbi:MAG: hypothetical protein IKU69_06780, partial [Roseburia sp.]|nr:hypothetical protein [Roseburia sp.]
MTTLEMKQIFEETAYIRTGGSAEELKCAEYIKEKCATFGAEAVIEPFLVDMAEIQEAVLIIDGKEIPCKGYLGTVSGEVEAPLYYLDGKDAYSLAQCKGKIVMIDGYLGHWVYQDIVENGAVGFITYDGNANYADEDIDQRELRSYVAKGNFIPGVNINAKNAIDLIKNDAQTAKIVLKQRRYKG